MRVVFGEKGEITCFNYPISLVLIKLNCLNQRVMMISICLSALLMKRWEKWLKNVNSI